MPAIKVGDIDPHSEVHGQGFPLALIAGIGYYSSLPSGVRLASGWLRYSWARALILGKRSSIAPTC